jgi:hypothetical protein
MQDNSQILIFLLFKEESFWFLGREALNLHPRRKWRDSSDG